MALRFLLLAYKGSILGLAAEVAGLQRPTVFSALTNGRQTETSRRCKTGLGWDAEFNLSGNLRCLEVLLNGEDRTSEKGLDRRATHGG